MPKGHFLFDRTNRATNQNMATTDTIKPKSLSPPQSEEERLELREFHKKKRTYEKIQVSKKLSKLDELLRKLVLSNTEISQISKWTKEIQQRMIVLNQHQEQVILHGTGNPEEDEELLYLDKIEEAVEEITQKAQERLDDTKQRSRQSSSNGSDSEEDNDDDQQEYSSQFHAGKRKEKNMTKDEKAFFALLSMQYNVKQEVPKFDGNDVTKYPSFRQAWESADKKLEKMGKTPAEKLLELKKVLGGKALKYIGNLTDSHDRNYEGALNMLDRYYYDNQITGKSAIDKLLALPKMGNDTDSMEEVFFELANIHQILEGLQLSSEEGKTLLFTTIAESKLNTYVRKSWARKCEEKEDRRHPLGHKATEKDFFSVIEREIKLSRNLTSKKKEEKKDEKKEERKREEKKKEERKTIHGSFGAQKQDDQSRKCQVCSKTGHPNWRCSEITSKSVPERWELIKQKKLCRLCFDKHKTTDCKFRSCDIKGCGRPHSRLLHADKQVSNSAATQQNEQRESTQENSQPTNCSLNSSGKQSHTAILQSCLVWACSDTGEKYKARVFLDSGSEISLVTRKLAGMMGLDGERVELAMNVAGGGESATTLEKRVNLQIESLDGKYRSPKISATTVKTITKDLREVPVDTSKFDHLKNIKFTEEFPRAPAAVDIMIGLPWYNILVAGMPIMGKPFEPMALPTKFGYVLTGTFPENSNKKAVNYTSLKCSVDTLNTTLEKFWDLESIGVTSSKNEHLTAEEDTAIEMMDKVTFYKKEEKTWYTSLLLKDNTTLLNDNFDRAKAVMIHVEKSAVKDKKVEQINEAYTDVKTGGFAEKVPTNEIEKPQGKVHYLQCHPVFREDKITTKCRIVMNASAKKKGEKSLNDLLFQGPCLLPDLIHVLIRFRINFFAFIMDISKMFLRIKLKDGKDFLRFLWRNCDTTIPPEIWRMIAISFGMISSPFQAIYVLRKHADLFEKQFPLAHQPIHESTYMDDVSEGNNDLDKAKEVIKQIFDLLLEASMQPHKILSNEPAILEDIPTELLNEEKIVKVLGVQWNTEKDAIMFNFIEKIEHKQDTKRTFLQQSASIFDPLGMIAPFVTKVKILFQELWLKKLEWDQPLPPDIQLEWDKWKSELKELKDLEKPRCFFDKTKGTATRVTLFAFGDASIKAYASAVYIVGTYPDGTGSAELVFSKTRVAPIKNIGGKHQKETIVRLELLAALITARAVKYVAEALKSKITIDDIFCFTDSMINLHRIRRGPEKFKIWVSNRIEEILSLTTQNQWNFCPGIQNPADLPSRGLSAKELIDSKIWWNGPDFICQDQNTWPKEEQCSFTDNEIKTKESDTSPLVFITTENEQFFWTVFNRFSNWEKTVKLFARILRLGCPSHKKFRGKQFSVSEKQQTELFLMRMSQKMNFSKEIAKLSKGDEMELKNSPIREYNPTWDDSRNIIFSNSRLSQSNIATTTKFPILLPKNCPIVEKYVLNMHILHSHAGPGYVLALLRQKFRLCQGRRQVTKIIHKCPKRNCTKPVPLTQQMAPLPTLRIEEAAAFRNVAVDLFGPMYVKHWCKFEDCPHPKDKKVYCALFTCFHSRAVHLELLKDQGTDDFLHAFRSFVGRRGTPNTMYSDNAKNFKAAAKEIRSLFKSINWERVKIEGQKQNIEWIFNTEKAPWGNAICERLVRTVKTPMRIIVGTAKLTERQLSVILTEIEGIVNNRPLATVTDHPDDLVPITPAELIIGRRMETLPDPNLRNKTNETNIQHLWRKRQHVLNGFWKRWRHDYLLAQNIRKKWHTPTHNDLLNKVVLIQEDNLCRNEWKMGRIIETVKSKDGLIRTVVVKTSTSTLKRPIQRIALLENVF